VIVVLCSWSGGPASRPDNENSTEKLLHQVGDFFELYDDALTYKP